MSACGLDRATRFDLDTILWLPWASEWFEPPLNAGNSPVIGTLTEHAIKMLQITAGMRQNKAMKRAAEQEAEPELNLLPRPDPQRGE